MHKIVPHPTIPHMFYIQWPDDVLSRNFYNKTWAKEHCAVLMLKESN